MPSFSRRTNWPLQSNPLIDQYKTLKKQHADFVDLTLSNLTSCGLTSLNQGLLPPLSQLAGLSYEPLAQGSLSTRQSVCGYYARHGFKVHPDQIFLTSSTSEGYSYLFRLLGNFSERVLFPQPSYPLFQYLVDLNDLKMDYYPLTYDQTWKLDHEILEASVDSSTRAIVVVNPNNPTGSYIKGDEYKQLVDICRKHDLSILADEVFWDYQFIAGQKPFSFVDRKDVLTFTLSGLSKILGLPQMKLSWIVVSGPDEIAREAKERLEIIADTYLSVSTPIQLSAETWFQSEANIQNEVKKRLQNNLSFLKSAFKDSSTVELLDVEGGWYAICKLPFKYSDEEWTNIFLTEDHVFVHPGYFYDFIDDGHIVISLLVQPELFKEAITKIVKRVESF